MDYTYWKKLDNYNYSFKGAIDIMMDSSQTDIEIRVQKTDSYKEVSINKNNLPNNLDDISLPMWAINSTSWHIYVPDYDMENKVNELRDYLDDVYQVDTRFYDINKMTIGQIFDQFDTNVFDDDIRIKILLWLRDNNMIPKRY